MDRARVISIAEGEIKRKEAQAKLGGWFANDYLEAAGAIRELLDAYTQLYALELESLKQTGMPLAELFSQDWGATV